MEKSLQRVQTWWATDGLPWKQLGREPWPGLLAASFWKPRISPCFVPAFSDASTSYLPPQDALLLREW